LAGPPPQRVDFAWPDRQLAIEIDGHQWHSTRTQRAKDAKRENAIKVAGWQVLRFTTDLGASDLGDPDHCSRSHGG